MILCGIFIFKKAKIVIFFFFAFQVGTLNNEDFKDVDKMRTIHEAFQFLCQTFADDVVKNTMANKKLGALDTGPYRVSGMYFRYTFSVKSQHS